jgi:hypothetical protein
VAAVLPPLTDGTRSATILAGIQTAVAAVLPPLTDGTRSATILARIQTVLIGMLGAGRGFPLGLQAIVMVVPD